MVIPKKGLTEGEAKALSDQLYQKHGSFEVPANADRFHIDGYRVTGSGPEVSLIPGMGDGKIYLNICLDPWSPIGQVLARYCVPFELSPEFHFDQVHLWIYPAGEGLIRIEVRFPAQRRFADQDEHGLEMVYGVIVKTSDVHYLERT